MARRSCGIRNRDVYIVGMKSYGRAPTFLMITGYEQVRSVVAALAGDWEAARDTRLVLPETGVCHGPESPPLMRRRVRRPIRLRARGRRSRCRAVALAAAPAREAAPAAAADREPRRWKRAGARFPYPFVFRPGRGAARRLGQLLLRVRDSDGADGRRTRLEQDSRSAARSRSCWRPTVFAPTASAAGSTAIGGRLLMTAAAFGGAGLLFLWAQVTEIWQSLRHRRRHRHRSPR